MTQNRGREEKLSVKDFAVSARNCIFAAVKPVGRSAYPCNGFVYKRLGNRMFSYSGSGTFLLR